MKPAIFINLILLYLAMVYFSFACGDSVDEEPENLDNTSLSHKNKTDTSSENKKTQHPLNTLIDLVNSVANEDNKSISDDKIDLILDNHWNKILEFYKKHPTPNIYVDTMIDNSIPLFKKALPFKLIKNLSGNSL